MKKKNSKAYRYKDYCKETLNVFSYNNVIEKPLELRNPPKPERHHELKGSEHPPPSLSHSNPFNFFSQFTQQSPFWVFSFHSLTLCKTQSCLRTTRMFLWSEVPHNNLVLPMYTWEWEVQTASA